MSDWNQAVEKFLLNWQDRTEFEGAILCGSFAVGCQTPASDIDVMIVLTNKTKWWERGNLIIDGFLIEYIADPLLMWQQAFKENVISGTRLNIGMFAVGQILVDKNGKASKLKEEAIELMKQPINKMDLRSKEMAKYHFYDRMDKLRGMEKDGFSAYAPLYYLHLSYIISSYANFLGIPLPSTAKFYKFLNDGDFRQKYQLAGFNDQEFIQLVNGSLLNFSSLDEIKKLTEYVTNKLGGFKIDGWILKTDID